MQPVATTSKEATSKKPRALRDYISVTLSGFAMGVCEIIPGVSGGTMAFILGIYEELIDSIKSVGDRQFLRAVFRLRIKDVFQILNWQFLVALALGMFLAILSLANLLGWILEHHPVFLWSFFFGLLLASVLLVSKRIERWSPTLLGLLVLAAITAYMLVGLVPARTPNTWWFLLLSGAVAICAMILPGVSGAFILVLLQKYEFVLNAVRTFDLATLFFVGAGAVIGLVTFAQAVSWLFKRYHDMAVATLAGLMLGSLREIWPWKESLAFIDTHEAPSNILPAMTVNGRFNVEIALAFLLALAGIAAIVAIERLGNGTQPRSLPVDAF